MELPNLSFRAQDYFLNDFTGEPETILNYKKHFRNLTEASGLPPAIYAYYFSNNKPFFQYLSILGKLPVPTPVFRAAIINLIAADKPDKFLYIQNYQQGFYQGLEDSFVPFVDTPGNRKEFIFKTVQQTISYFPEEWITNKKDNHPYSRENYTPEESLRYKPNLAYTPEGFYKYGVKVGQVYKAWNYILENPGYYETDFELLNKPPVKVAYGALTPSAKRKRQAKMNYLTQLEEQIEAAKPIPLKEREGVTSPIIKEEPPKRKKQFLNESFSNSQIVLVFYYFFKSLGLEPRTNNLDIAPVARFLHLITGTEITKIYNSEFYKKLKAVPNFKTDKELIKDLRIIRGYFEKVHLNNIVMLIENEINIAQNQIDTNKY